MTDPVLARVAAIKTMPTPALKTMWRELHGTDAPPYNRRFLESRLAYRVQELAYGGLKPETVKRLDALARGVEDTDPKIGERIRDKFAASRRKGMWMGGFVPLGYRVENRKLVINEAEASTVRMIFERFVRVGSATVLERELIA